MEKAKVLRRMVAFWELFIGIGALAGAAMMFADPSGRILGMEPMLPLFQVLPFADLLYGNFIFPGMALLCVNGVPSFVAYGLLRRGSKWAPAAGIVCGCLLMLWIGVQFYLFPMNFMSTIYFIFGAMEMLTAIMWTSAMKKQEATEK